MVLPPAFVAAPSTILMAPPAFRVPRALSSRVISPLLEPLTAWSAPAVRPWWAPG